MSDKNKFTSSLLEWFKDHERDLPWKTTNDPYKIWLSEIILQQTRVAQGMPYYLKFIEYFPTIRDLAMADEDEVMKCWKGLGYYSRARNLHYTAKWIVSEYNGIFPDNYDDILALKGVGPYTAAAISSFAFGLPYAVVDGNVLRVLSRYYGIEKPVDDKKTYDEIKSIAQGLIPKDEPGDFNQAIMDFGATQCIPKNPLCSSCVMQSHCNAFEDNTVNLLPYKSKKIKQRKRFFHYLVIHNEEGEIILHKRKEKDIWQNLYDFPVIEKESSEPLSSQEVGQFIELKFNAKSFKILSTSEVLKQTLTHQKINATFYDIKINNKHLHINDPFNLVEQEKLLNFAYPKVIDDFVRDNFILNPNNQQ